MHFKTTFNLKKADFDIEYQHFLFFIGSCFSVNMSTVLAYHKFKTLANPFGTVYNPISIFEQIESISQKKIYQSSDFFYYDEKYTSFDFHSDIASTSLDIAVNQINSKISEANEALKKTAFVFITFGTAWVYEEEKQQKIVANCHKIPAKNFTKRLLTVDEIVNKAKSSLAQLARHQKIIFTLSPVRHLRDGFIENNQSKAVLTLAIYELLKQNKQFYYFPAYEFVIDDLRDYRFYESDLIHPNAQAIAYIFEQFVLHYFNEKTQNLSKEVENIQKMLQHKVQFIDTEQYKKFKRSLLEKIDFLEQKGFDFADEKKSLSL